MSIETLVKTEAEKSGLEYKKIILETGRLLYFIDGKSYTPKDAVETFVPGGWEGNYRDI